MASRIHLVFALVVLSWLCAVPRNVNGQALYVAAILDGERLVLSNGERVKLIGVEALEKFGHAATIREAIRLGVDPESIQIKGGIEAYYLTMLVESREVLVSYAQQEITAAQNEQIFRPAYVSVLNDEGNIAFVLNRRLIRDGYASVDAGLPFYYFETFLEIQHKAVQERRGMWAYYDFSRAATVKGGVKSSKSISFNSECRRYSSCVWVSAQDNYGIGYWKSVAGQHCPCG